MAPIMVASCIYLLGCHVVSECGGGVGVGMIKKEKRRKRNQCITFRDGPKIRDPFFLDFHFGPNRAICPVCIQHKQPARTPQRKNYKYENHLKDEQSKSQLTFCFRQMDSNPPYTKLRAGGWEARFRHFGTPQWVGDNDSLGSHFQPAT